MSFVLWKSLERSWWIIQNDGYDFNALAATLAETVWARPPQTYTFPITNQFLPISSPPISINLLAQRLCTEDHLITAPLAHLVAAHLIFRSTKPQRRSS